MIFFELILHSLITCFILQSHVSTFFHICVCNFHVKNYYFYPLDSYATLLSHEDFLNNLMLKFIFFIFSNRLLYLLFVFDADWSRLVTIKNHGVSENLIILEWDFLKTSTHDITMYYTHDLIVSQRICNHQHH